MIPRNRSYGAFLLPKIMSVDIDTRRLNNIIRNANGRASKIVRSIAFAIEAKAKMKAPVDTGALRASIYTKVKGGDGGLPDVPNPDAMRADFDAPTEELVAHVGPSVEYAVAQEFGTARTAAQPYLIPAVREVENDLERNGGDWGSLVDGE